MSHLATVAERLPLQHEPNQPVQARQNGAPAAGVAGRLIANQVVVAVVAAGTGRASVAILIKANLAIEIDRADLKAGMRPNREMSLAVRSLPDDAEAVAGDVGAVMGQRAWSGAR